MLRKIIAFIAIGIMSMNIANVEAATNGSTDTSTITVVTKADWYRPGSESITLKNRKVTVKGVKKSFYPKYRVVVRSTDGHHAYNSWLSGAKLKLNLKPDKTYKIRVDFNKAYGNNSYLSYKGNVVVSPYWWVSETHKVKSCY